LAAHRAGVKAVILPRRNERDLEDVPVEVRRDIQFVLVDSAEEVLQNALTNAPAEAGVSGSGGRTGWSAAPGRET
jgi:ATP-dependent Lon protease